MTDAASRAVFEVLHLLRIRGLARPGTLDGAEGLVGQGLAAERPHGVMLTPAGLARHEELLHETRVVIDLETLAATYERFLAVNGQVKGACAGWQAGAQDEDALFLMVSELGELIERVGPALERAGSVVVRFGGYAPRLEAALGAIEGGDRRFVTDPTVDSVHTVWFECHEDYLTMLGRDRETEGSF